MKRVLLIGFAISGVLGALFFLVVLPNLRPSDTPLGSWPDYEQASSLIQHSDQIIIAVYLDETVHMIPAISPVDGEAHGSVTEIYRRFKVEDPLKGHGKKGETIHIIWTAGYSRETEVEGKDEFIPFEVVPLEAGQEYVLFLHSTFRKPGYPSEYGEVVWIITGEPGIATLNNEEKLLFAASGRYKSAVDEKGLNRPAGSAAPFELSKQDIEDIVGGAQ